METHCPDSLHFGTPFPYFVAIHLAFESYPPLAAAFLRVPLHFPFHASAQLGISFANT